MSDQAEKAKRPGVLMTFEEVKAAYHPMGQNQVYQAFRTGQVPGGRRIGGRWYADRAVFERAHGVGVAA